jgi:hypothetical protein
MMCLIAKNQKKFQSAKLKNSIYSFDKSDAKNLILPSFIETYNEENLYENLLKIVQKYENKNYKLFEREELEELLHWNDLEVLTLLKFYKNQWSFSIDREIEFFPSFVFTYNILPLKKECDKIVSICYDKIDSTIQITALEDSFTFNALDVTYLLHFFVISHIDYIGD